MTAATLDLTPRPGAAPATRRVLRHALLEGRLLVRNGEQLLLALIIPLGILVAGRIAGGRMGSFQTLAPAVLALAVWSSAFTSVAIATAFERRYGVLERLATTPLQRGGLLAGKAVAVALVVVGQLVVLTVAGLLLGWRPRFGVAGAALAVALIVLATGTFVALALLLAARLRAEAVLGVANLVYLLFLTAGALVIPLARYPQVVQPALHALPTAALGEGLRAAAEGHLLGWPPVVLTAWFVASALLAGKGFRWIG